MAEAVLWGYCHRLFERPDRFRCAALLHQEVTEIYIRLLAGMEILFLPRDRLAVGFDRGIGLPARLEDEPQIVLCFGVARIQIENLQKGVARLDEAGFRIVGAAQIVPSILIIRTV